MTPELAGKAVELRAARGPFVSADDLSVSLGLPVGWLASLADLTVYLA
jgi:DNA uptake protein ComE-like DNA-binding protein